MIRRLLVTAAALVAGLVAPQLAAAATIDFSEAAAITGQSANTIYAANPGVTFAEPIPQPVGSQMGTGRSCGVTVTTPLAGHGRAGRLGCGGSAEFPDPPMLFGAFKPTTRTNLSMLVGHFGNDAFKMRLALYDEGGKLIASKDFTTTGSGTSVALTTGSPNVMYFLLTDLDQYPSTTSAVWIDSLVFDDPPVKGKPGLDVTPTSGDPSVLLVQGGSAVGVDATVTSINNSARQFSVAFSGMPAGVTATQGTSVNGFSVQLTADPRAPVTPESGYGYVTVTVTPKDAASGTVAHVFRISVRVTPAMTVSITGSAHVPSCTTNTVYFNIAPHAGPANVSIEGLPAGISATLGGQPVDGSGTLTGGGARELAFVQSKPVTAPFRATLKLTGQWYTSSYAHVTSKYEASSAIDVRTAGAFDVSPTALRTPQELQPGTSVELKGDDLCTTANAGIQFGSKDAIVPVNAVGARTFRLDTPRTATSGVISVIPDMSHPEIRFDSAQYVSVDSYRNTAGFAFHNYKPNLTFDQMTDAFGYDETHYSPNICGTFSFGLINCKISTPIPDPWAVTVLTIANQTMGGGSGGACFGFSKTSEQLRTGVRSLRGFGNDAAKNAYELDWRGGAGGGLQETINTNQLTQLSSQYLDFYAKEAVGNVLSQNWQTLRGEIEGYLRRGDHPMLSLRDGGSFSNLHVVVAYDIEPDEQGFGGYYIDVYDSNYPYGQLGYEKGNGFDETDNAMGQHLFALQQSRIHVRTDNSWSLPSSKMGASTMANIIVSGKDMPGKDPTLIGGKQALKDGLTILLGWTAAGLLDDGTSEAAAPAPSHVTQVESGGRKLYSSPGVLNADPKTALRATPWSPATGDQGSDGLLLAQGPGADYTVSVTGDKAAAQSRTIMGDDMIAQVNSDAEPGVTDALHVAPKDNEITFDPGGKGSSPLDVSMMVKAGDGTTRVANVTTKTHAGGSDSVSFDGSENGVVLAHDGPATTVDLTLSVAGGGLLPQAVETRVPVGKNATTTIKTASWKDLSRGQLTSKSGGHTRKLHARRKSGKGTRISKIVVDAPRGGARVAHAQVTVPPNVQAGMTTVTFAVRRGRKVIGTGSASAGGPGSRTIDLTLPAKAKKGDKLIAVATTLLQDGTTFSSTTSTRRGKLS